MWNKILSLVWKWVVSFSFLAVFLIFSEHLMIIPYFLGIVTSLISVFFSVFCYMWVSADAINLSDFIVSSLVYILILLWIYSVLK